MNDINDPKLFDGLTAKQKKNLRKKLQRKRKKAVGKDTQSAADESLNSNSKCSNESPDAGQDVPKGQEIDDLDIDIGDDKDKDSNSDKEEQEEKEKSAKKSDEGIYSKRGRKLDETVMVKICDLGNGCWTHHHFTPEI